MWSAHHLRLPLQGHQLLVFVQIVGLRRGGLAASSIRGCGGGCRSRRGECSSGRALDKANGTVGLRAQGTPRTPTTVSLHTRLFMAIAAHQSGVQHATQPHCRQSANGSRCFISTQRLECTHWLTCCCPPAGCCCCCCCSSGGGRGSSGGNTMPRRSCRMRFI